MTTQLSDFGCPKCVHKDPKKSWNAFLELPITKKLVSESHFSVGVRTCDQCGQHYVMVFTERIDWSGGDDPQETTVLPITEKELEFLSHTPRHLIEDTLSKLAPERRSLVHDFPREAKEPKDYWAAGIYIMPYD